MRFRLPTVLLAVAGILLAIPWTAPLAQPRLAVVLVVDQMRADVVDQLGPQFEGGFKRLLEQGALFENAHHDHAVSVTASGHATISTGAFPSAHGVVGNDFWDRVAHESAEAVWDADVAMVGAERRVGRSPQRLLRPAIGDWLKSRFPAAKVFGVSIKDRSAIFLGGRTPDGAYWYDERAGNFASSTYYLDALPAWVTDFNAERRVDRYFGTVWTHGGAVDAARAASVEPPAGFAHSIGDPDLAPDRAFYRQFRLTPFADELTLDFSRALIEHEAIGADTTPDLLLIGLSAIDFIGHREGPFSDEVRDAFLRLDDHLGDFLAYLDDELGPDNYEVVLTSDHGVMPLPETLAASGMEAGRIHPRQLYDYAQPFVDAAYEQGVIERLPERLRWRSGIVFQFEEPQPPSAEVAALARIVADGLLQQPFVEDVMTYSQILEGDVRDAPWAGRFVRSFHPERAPDIFLYLRPNYLVTGDANGTSHGTPHAYDTHVPLVFWGNGIAPRRHTGAVRTVDIAPTLASLLGIALPSDIDGTDLSPVLRVTD